MAWLTLGAEPRCRNQTETAKTQQVLRRAGSEAGLQVRRRGRRRAGPLSGALLPGRTAIGWDRLRGGTGAAAATLRARVRRPRVPAFPAAVPASTRPSPRGRRRVWTRHVCPACGARCAFELAPEDAVEGPAPGFRLSAGAGRCGGPRAGRRVGRGSRGGMEVGRPPPVGRVTTPRRAQVGLCFSRERDEPCAARVQRSLVQEPWLRQTLVDM